MAERRNYQKGPAYGPERFDHFVLQGFFSDETGWADIKLADSLEEILKVRDRYKRSVPHRQYRVQSVSTHGKRRAVRISMSHLNNSHHHSKNRETVNA